MDYASASIIRGECSHSAAGQCTFAARTAPTHRSSAAASARRSVCPLPTRAKPNTCQLTAASGTAHRDWAAVSHDSPGGGLGRSTGLRRRLATNGRQLTAAGGTTHGAVQLYVVLDSLTWPSARRRLRRCRPICTATRNCASESWAAAWAGTCCRRRRREFCHSADALSPSLLKHLRRERGVQQN